MTTNWTDDELLAYMLIYCSHADLSISAEEKEYIVSRFTKDVYDKMLSIYDSDSDEIRMRKIKDGCDDHIYNNNETDVIYEEMHNIFNIDGDFDDLEKNVLNELDKVLSN